MSEDDPAQTPSQGPTRSHECCPLASPRDAGLLDEYSWYWCSCRKGAPASPCDEACTRLNPQRKLLVKHLGLLGNNPEFILWHSL